MNPNNYFQLFQLTPEYTIDLAKLNQSYRTLQQQLHPDKQLQQQSLQNVQQAADLNNGYQALKSPVSRAEHLLAVLGYEHDPTQVDRINDPMFLMQQLEMREQLESIEQAQDEDALYEFQDEVKAQEKSLVTEITEAFNNKQLPDAALAAAKLKFYFRLNEEIGRIEDQFE